MTTTTTAEPPALSRKEVRRVMTGLLAGLFTALLSTTIVSTALPTIMADLDGTQREYTWVITASLLMMTVSTPIWGKFSDLFNKKQIGRASCRERVEIEGDGGSRNSKGKGNGKDDVTAT